MMPSHQGKTRTQAVPLMAPPEKAMVEVIRIYLLGRQGGDSSQKEERGKGVAV